MNNAVLNLLFYAFALISIVLAISVVTTRKILRAAVYLMGVLVASAAFFLLLDAEFLAGVQILVYVGGIVVLLVFAVMLTRSVELLEDHPSKLRMLLGFVAAASFLGMTVGIFQMSEFPLLKSGVRNGTDTMELGRKLLDYGPQGYALPFEIISLLLLAAVIGGIVIARKTAAEKAATQPNEAGHIKRAHVLMREAR